MWRPPVLRARPTVTTPSHSQTVQRANDCRYGWGWSWEKGWHDGWYWQDGLYWNSTYSEWSYGWHRSYGWYQSWDRQWVEGWHCS